MASVEHSPTLMASSAQRKQQMSITLPRNFAPSGFDLGDDPKTPDQTFAQLKLPPPPHHSTLRLRRPRVNMENFQSRNNALPATLFASDIPIPSSAHSLQSDFSLSSATFSSDLPIPSIEAPIPVVRPTFHHSLTDPSPIQRLQLPAPQDQAPRTPLAQTKITLSEYKPSIWDMQRSASECSARSDSSLSSGATFTTRPTSFDGSTTSPDLESYDPFSPKKFNLIADTPSRTSKKPRLNIALIKDKVQWSIEMDNHLFNVYQMYLADPAVTPFKTVPGSIPPTGVCHRVARRAKETWSKASRVPKPIVRRYKLRNVFEDRGIGREKTPEPNDFLRTDSASSARDGRPIWPSESATRKRLKQLCREKFTISAHYQRLRESRSPSPFTDQFLKRPSSRLGRSTSQQLPESQPSTSYATRELGISLVASGATAPLAQLVTGDSPSLENNSDEWFNTPVNPSSDEMNVSPPSGLGIKTDHNKLTVASGIPRLASPFTYSTWNGSSHANSQHRRHISQNQFDTIHATGSRLLSPFKLEPDVSFNVHKRRAQHNLEDELSPSGSHITERNALLPPELSAAPVKQEHQSTQELIFTGAGDISQRRIRLRNRGATLGSTTNNREHIERFFTPPTVQVQTDGLIPPLPALPPSLTSLSTTTNSTTSTLAPPEVDPTQKRLGSPFELDPNKRSHRARSPRHVPSLSDPFLTTSLSSGMNMSIGERLAMFTSSNDGPEARRHTVAHENQDPFM